MLSALQGLFFYFAMYVCACSLQRACVQDFKDCSVQGRSGL